MKRVVGILALMACVFLGLGTCDLWYGIFGDPIVGTWNLTAATFNGSDLVVGPSGYEETLTVAKDNTISMVASYAGGTPVTFTGTWSRSGTTYTLFYPASAATGNQDMTWTGTLSSDGKTLSFTIESGPSTGSGTFVKQ